MFLIEDTDKGWKKITKALRAEVANVGVQDDGSPRQDGEVSNLDLAVIHEFGTARTPSRSFIRSSFDENKKEYARLLEKGAEKILAGERDVHTIVGALGEKCLSDIKSKIDSNIPPPLNPRTIKAKGSSVALIDSGQMKNSLTVKFDEG